MNNDHQPADTKSQTPKPEAGRDVPPDKIVVLDALEHLISLSMFRQFTFSAYHNPQYSRLGLCLIFFPTEECQHFSGRYLRTTDNNKP